MRKKFGESESIVDTAEVLARTLEVLQSSKNAFICTNVQETDLCGHRQDSKAYADKLRIADEYMGQIRSSLKPEDYLIVMADHGNDRLSATLIIQGSMCRC
jgi:phosphopentomutase